MKYRYVLLKDLPEHKAGTVFRGCGRYSRFYDNPEWFRKEIDMTRTIDLKCPKCKGTRMFLYSDEIYNLNKEREGFCRSGCIESALAFQCVSCGRKRIIYGAGEALQRIENQMEEDQNEQV